MGIISALLSGVGAVGEALDTPGAYLRGALAGRPGERVSGERMLDSMGVDAGPIGGFLAEMLLDPTNLIPGKAIAAGLGAAGTGATALLAAKAIKGRRLARTNIGGKPIIEAASGVTDDLGGLLNFNRPVLGEEAAYDLLAPQSQALDEAEGLLSKIRAIEAPEAGIPFYSRLERAGEQLSQRQPFVKPEGAVNSLRRSGDFAQEELDFTGLESMLKRGDLPLDIKGRVATKDLLREIQNRRPQVQETRRIESAGDVGDVELRLHDEYQSQVENFNAGNLTTRQEVEFPLRMNRALQAMKQHNPQYKDHRHLGSIPENDEVILSVPNVPNEFKYGGHFDTPNAVAHFRTTSLPAKKGVGGQKTLFVEEIQSDLHQAGRKQGYLPKEGGVPDAPFKGNAWVELSLKKVIDHAVRTGHDKVAFTKGKWIQRVVGGDLGGQEEFYDKILPNALRKLSKKFGGKVEVERLAGVRAVDGGEAHDAAISLRDDLLEAFRRGEPSIVHLESYLDNAINAAIGENYTPALFSSVREAVRDKYGGLTDIGDYRMLSRAGPGFFEKLILDRIDTGKDVVTLTLTPSAKRKLLKEGLPLMSAGGAALGAGALATQWDKEKQRANPLAGLVN